MNDNPPRYKQVIAVRKDLGMRKGKMIAQGAHAAMTAVERADEDDKEFWRLTGQTKIVVGIEGHEAAVELYEEANVNGVAASLIQDEGRTELEPGTVTAVGIGPAEEQIVDQYTGNLNLL